jgi:hypothetical protein
MKIRYALIPFALLAAVSASAQGVIWRCGNTYTNDKAEAQAKGCKAVEGGNVTVVQGTKVNGANRSNVVTAPEIGGRDGASRVASNEQRSRDAEARTILETELKKAEGRRADLVKEYNNGEPEKMGPEHKNHQKWLDRVADLKSSIERTDQDIAGLKRELSREPGANSTSANSANSAAK